MAFFIFLIMTRYIALLVAASIFQACDSSEKKEIFLYEGPLREMENVELHHSDAEKVKLKLQAKLVYEFQNGDREFPKGLYLEFYDEFGQMTSTLRANHAFFFKDKNQWRGQGNVEVKNVLNDEQLNTEELFWKPTEEKIFTDKFVTIRQQSDVMYGDGLEAKQDLSLHKILNPKGTFRVEDK